MKDVAPVGTFDKAPFDALLNQYDHGSSVPPTLELSQAFLMTVNMKQAANQLALSGNQSS